MKVWNALLVGSMLLAAAPVIAAPAAPSVIMIEVDSDKFSYSAFLNAPPMSDLEPGGFVIPQPAEPAWLAIGLQPGDVILTEDGDPVGDTLTIGDGVTMLGIVRKGKPVILHITKHGSSRETGTLDDDDMDRLYQATPPFSAPVRNKSGPSGVRVTDLLVAIVAKVSVGDIVRTIGGKPIRSDVDFIAALRALPIGPTDIVVERLGRPVTVTVTREAPPDLTRIKKLTATSFEIPADIAAAIGKDMAIFERKAKFEAFTANSKRGIKLIEIESGSVFAAAGFLKDDVILDVDGHAIDTREAGYRTLRTARNATSLTVNLLRRGKPLAIRYAIK